MGKQCGIKIRWSCASRYLLISKKQQVGGISMKQLPEENYYGNAWQEIWLKASPIFFYFCHDHTENSMIQSIFVQI